MSGVVAGCGWVVVGVAGVVVVVVEQRVSVVVAFENGKTLAFVVAGARGMDVIAAFRKLFRSLWLEPERERCSD